MADEPDNVEDPDGVSHEPRECMACRGSGQVISNLGGEPKSVSCPWCNGTGMRVPGIDAQASWPRSEPAGGTEEQSPPAGGTQDPKAPGD